MKKFATILTSAVLCSGCATITQGTTEALYVTSDPSNANVKLSTGQQGRTPATFEVSKKKGFMVTISKDGYQDANVQVVSSIGGTSGMATAGNVIAGGGIGGRSSKRGCVCYGMLHQSISENKSRRCY